MSASSLASTLRVLWRWQPGRQSTGYAKLLLATAPWPVGFDLYLLRYRQGQGIPRHTDPVPGKRHWRLNVELVRSAQGGRFICHGPCHRWGRVVLFRPDQCPHEVLPVQAGRRYVLSLGWVRSD